MYKIVKQKIWFMVINNWSNNRTIMIFSSSRLFGWVICSQRSPDADKVILGATLEIQRLQREEILEQQLMRQQVRQFQNLFSLSFILSRIND